MLRPFVAFLVVFSVLSLLVQLNVLGSVFGIAALSLFAADEAVLQLAKNPRSSRLPGEPLF